MAMSRNRVLQKAKMLNAVRIYRNTVDAPEFQATTDNQCRFWLNRMKMVKNKYGDDNPLIQLYQLYAEYGAVTCPFEIYNLFADLYISERDILGQDAMIKMRDINSYGTDQWILLTRPSDYEIPFGLKYNQHVLIGPNVDADHLATLRYAAASGDNRKWLGQDKLPGCLNWMSETLSADGHYAGTSMKGYGVCLYGSAV